MSQDINVVMISLDQLKPYEKNPRQNDDAVEYVANSIREFGFKVPIVVDKEGTIVAGHTRYKAAKRLGMDTVPCIVADDLTEEQIKAFRLADNKTAEMSEWDFDMLGVELAGIEDLDMSMFGFDLGEELGDDGDDGRYTWDVNIPQYKITGDRPAVKDLFDTGRANELMENINAAAAAGEISPEEQAFLAAATQRHNVFNYRNIAEYYAHATPAMQRLMEESALVIIDVNNAIANGYATLNSEVMDMMGGEEGD